MARPGNVGFLSQSGALCTAILDWSLREHVGFSAFVSVGSMLDVGWGDLIDYLGDDPHTQSIVIYMESIGDARSFLSAAREVALTKPIIVIKAGPDRGGGAGGGLAHRGAGRQRRGARRRLPPLRRAAGRPIAELFYMAEVLAKQPRPRGPRLAIVTNAGGPGVLATDALIARRRRARRAVARDDRGARRASCPPHWSHGNPIDILGDAGPDRYAQALEVAAKDPDSDGLLVILTPQAMTDPTQTAEQLQALRPDRRASRSWRAGWAGPTSRRARRSSTRRASPPSPTPTPPPASSTPCGGTAYNLRGLYETPTLADEADGRRRRPRPAPRRSDRGRPRRGPDAPDRGRIEAVARRLRHPDRRRPGSPRTRSEAVAAADAIGYPVVLKLHSETITHKTDVGGVRLNLADAEAVRARLSRRSRRSVAERAGAGHFQGVTVQPMIRRDGYELIVGSSLDPQFGPVLLFGTGGQLVEVFKDRALALPPLNTTLARRMMEQTRIYARLEGGARPPAGRPGRAGAAAGAVQPARRRAALDQGDRHQPPARLARRAARARRPGDRCTARRSTTDLAPARRSAPIPTQYVAPWTAEDGDDAHDPADPPRGRAAAGPVPRDALGAERLAPLLPRDEAEPARRPRAPDADLLHRLRPRDGAGGRAARTRRPASARSSASAA